MSSDIGYIYIYFPLDPFFLSSSKYWKYTNKYQWKTVLWRSVNRPLAILDQVQHACADFGLLGRVPIREEGRAQEKSERASGEAPARSLISGLFFPRDRSHPQRSIVCYPTILKSKHESKNEKLSDCDRFARVCRYEAKKNWNYSVLHRQTSTDTWR